MSLLAGKNYDPAASVSKSTATAIAMTALDTTNLRLSFTVPSNGAVLVRMRGPIHGATTHPQVFFGVLEGSTVKGRVQPTGSLKNTAVATAQLTLQALFVVPGLTPAAALTWDAAYGVENGVASTGLKYGGPNNTTTNDAFGGLAFEIYDTPNLLGAVLYDPGTAAFKFLTSVIAMTAMDTTNLRITFTAPASGTVLVRISVPQELITTAATILLGVLDGATVKGRQPPVGGIPGTVGLGNGPAQEAAFLVTGLTPSTSYTWDAAYGVEVVSGSGQLRYGGPNDTTAANAYGGIGYEIWAV